MNDEKILEEFKNNLLISWEDKETEIKLKNCLVNANSHIESLTGTKIDYKENLFARTLLLNCARYYYNNVSEYFEDNFHKEILRLQFMEATGV